MALLNEEGLTVLKTTYTRKLTINGVTKAYSVYRININSLYYNDQNDRIATWMSEYRVAHPDHPIESLTKDDYNDVIERFIISSNPSSIEKTKTNIALVGQREAGVVLNDGRIIDGNRRFTCIRQLYKQNPANCWFEAVILDMDINNSKKMIKMLELTIQHGEEKRVDYNHVEKLVGIYQDIIETGLLSVEEYAASTNETVQEIKKKLESAKLLVEFLDFIHMPKQYYVAREYQIVSLLADLQELLKKCITDEAKNDLKKIVFTNLMMDTIGEERKFVNDVLKMMKNGTYDDFVSDQKEIGEAIQDRLDEQLPENQGQLKQFVRTNSDLTDELVDSLDKSLTGAKKQETRSKPSQNLRKTISTLKDIDIRIIDKLNPNEKEVIRNYTSKLSKMVESINEKASDEIPEETVEPVADKKPKVKDGIMLIPSMLDELICFDANLSSEITSLLISMQVNAQKPGNYEFMFVNKASDVCSNVIKLEMDSSLTRLDFRLESRVSEEKEIYLLVKKAEDPDGYARQLIKFDINLAFEADFGF